VSEGSPPDFFYVILEGSVEISQNMKVIRTLRDGDVFGLENYYRKRPYTTSASAITTTRVAAYSAETIRDILYTHPQLSEQIFSTILSQLEQTTGKVEEYMPFELSVPVQERIYGDGDVIIAENKDNQEMYRLVESQHGLRVTCQGRQIGTITRPGEYFGEMSLVLQQPSSATVTAVGRSRVQVFTMDNFTEDLRRHPDLALALISILAERLREVNRRLAERMPPCT